MQWIENQLISFVCLAITDIALLMRLSEVICNETISKAQSDQVQREEI
jgi:hypothetical protein